MLTLKSNSLAPCILPTILDSTNTVKPSFNQKCSKFLLVTRLPVQLWAISWATTSARDLSPAKRVGVTKVRHGFSMPPKGNEGGITRRSYCFQTYGPHNSVAVFSMVAVSENSSAQASTMASSAQTLEFSPSGRETNLPMAMATR